MACVLQIIEHAAGFPSTLSDLYVVECDVDAHNGRGSLVGSHNIDEAKRFANMREAMNYWRRVSRVCPFRDDGQPNRPLTAFTVTIVNIGSE